MSLRRDIEKLRKLVPKEPPPVPLKELLLFVDERVEEMIGQDPPDWYLKNHVYEGGFFTDFIERLPTDLFPIYCDVTEAMNLRATSLPELFEMVPHEVEERVLDSLPPIIQRRYRSWQENFHHRERRREWQAEQDRLFPQLKTHENGWDWWFRAQDNDRRALREWRDFDGEWSAFYERWEAACEEQPDGHLPVPEELCSELVRIVFRTSTLGEAIAEAISV